MDSYIRALNDLLFTLKQASHVARTKQNNLSEFKIRRMEQFYDFLTKITWPGCTNQDDKFGTAEYQTRHVKQKLFPFADSHHLQK